MTFDDIREYLGACEAASSEEVNWTDREDFKAENLPGVGPGGYLNRYGYFVFGTTVGGNAVVLCSSDDSVNYADHEWFSEDSIDYLDVSGDGKYHTLPYNHDNVRKALHELASDRESFVAGLLDGTVDQRLSELD